MSIRYQGFTLIDAMLGVTLLGGVLLYSAGHSARQHEQEQLIRAFVQLGDVVSAVDRRFSLDGGLSDWNSSVTGRESVREALVAELNSSDNHCGSWVPAVSGDDFSLSLLPCDFTFELSEDYLMALRVESDDRYASKWVLDVEGGNEFASRTLYAQLGDIQRIVTSRHGSRVGLGVNVSLIDSSTKAVVDSPDCLLSSSDCTLRIELGLHGGMDGARNEWLRLDGSSAMRASLYFPENLARCEDVDGVEIPCGLEHDSSGLSLRAGGVAASEFVFGASESCYDSSGSAVACGITMSAVEDVALHAHSVSATDSLTVKDGANPVLEVADHGLRTFNQGFVAHKDVKATTLMSETESMLRPDGRVDIERLTGATSSQVVSLGVLEYEGQRVRFRTVASAVEGQTCPSEYRGTTVTMTNSGELFACPNTSPFPWVSLSGGGAEMPSNGVVFFAQSTCPAGYTQLNSSSDPVQFLRRGFTYSNRNSAGEATSGALTASNAGWTVYGNNTYRFNIADMPRHSHTYSFSQDDWGGMAQNGSSVYTTDPFGSVTKSSHVSGGNGGFTIEPPNLPMAACRIN